jgi:hypothetical protein
MAPDHVIRAIDDDDLDQVVALLTEGFPRRTPAYWRSGLSRLAERDRPDGTETYGYAIDAGGELHGVVLAIPSMHDGSDGPIVMVNISSWFARQEFRGGPAKELYRHATARDDVTYTNLSAVPHTIKTIRGFGFHEWTAGQLICTSLRGGRSHGSGRLLSPRDAEGAGLAEAEASRLADHERLGCVTAVVETPHGLQPLIFLRRRIKRAVPCAQLIYCADVAVLVDHGRAISAALAKRGLPLMLVDSSGPVPGLTGRYVPAKASKYLKGSRPANAVDHTYSEMVLLGF